MVYWIWGKCIFTNHDFWYRKKHISWDEQTIAEHDKQRGSRMIINEPKTPYNRLGIEESDSLQIKRMIYRSWERSQRWTGRVVKTTYGVE